MTKLVRCGINFYADVDHQKAVNDRDSLQNTKLMEHYTTVQRNFLRHDLN